MWNGRVVKARGVKSTKHSLRWTEHGQSYTPRKARRYTTDLTFLLHERSSQVQFFCSSPAKIVEKGEKKDERLRLKLCVKIRNKTTRATNYINIHLYTTEGDGHQWNKKEGEEKKRTIRDQVIHKRRKRYITSWTNTHKTRWIQQMGAGHKSPTRSNYEYIHQHIWNRRMERMGREKEKERWLDTERRDRVPAHLIIFQWIGEAT